MLATTIQRITEGKVGFEIGGPSHHTGPEVYKHAKQLDNVIFSNTTVWSNHDSVYNYSPGKTGKVIINDAVNIDSVQSCAYDFCFSSHSLEHIANPLLAVSEWLRLTKKDGHLILILPERSMTFDHKRNVSKFQTLLKQFIDDVGEDDLSTLPEILEKHDLAMDPPAGTFEQFKARSLRNFENRCLHHYVYSPNLLMEICQYFNCRFVYSETEKNNIWFIMQKTY